MASRSAREIAYETIRSRIITMDLKPGDELNDRELAQELGISSIRGGGIVGEHDVLFCGPDEVVTLSHSAGSRGVFADGAVQAALYIAALTPGYYTMTDLLRGKLVCE